MHKYILPLSKEFTAEANPEIARGQKAYMREQFDYFGIKTPRRREILRAHMKSTPLGNEKELVAVVKELWALPEREYQYVAQELLGYYHKMWSERIIGLIEHCITHKSWWDTVDALNSEGAGPYFEKFPMKKNLITEKWNQSGNIWLNRSSLLFQKNYRQRTDTRMLSKYIHRLKDSKEFFIQKAIGWVLREYAKTDAAWVKKFAGSSDLAPLSRREALKNIS